MTFACSQWPCGGCCTWWGADGKVIIERLCISLPYVEKPFNSKVIKSFVPELRSRYVFFVFRDSYVLCIHVMSIICTFPIFMYGYVIITAANYSISNISHHHHVMWLARISLTLSLHVSLSFITSGRSSGLHPVSSHSCCMYVRAGRPAFDWPYVGSTGVHHLRAHPCFSSSVWHVCFV